MAYTARQENPCDTYKFYIALGDKLHFKPCKTCGWSKIAHQTDMDSMWNCRADLLLLLAEPELLSPQEAEIFQHRVLVLDTEIRRRLALGEKPSWFDAVLANLQEPDTKEDHSF